MNEETKQLLNNTEANETMSNGFVHSNDESVFICNVCLDIAKNPVITQCGHLFCWSCLYRWMNVKSTSMHSSTSNHLDNHTTPCPVCKCLVTKSNLIPLYVNTVNSNSNSNSSTIISVSEPNQTSSSSSNSNITGSADSGTGSGDTAQPTPTLSRLIWHLALTLSLSLTIVNNP